MFARQGPAGNGGLDRGHLSGGEHPARQRLVVHPYDRSFYFNDSYKKNRATINFGLRYDRQFDIARAASDAAQTPFCRTCCPAIEYDGADSGARYNNLSPRGGVTYDIRGDGKTRVQGQRRPLLRARHVYREHPPADDHDDAAVRLARLNGDNIVQRNELDMSKFLDTPTSNYNPANPSAVFTPATVDPNLRNDITDEFIGGIDHELMKNFAVGVSYIYRKYHQLQGTYRSDPADVTSAYTRRASRRRAATP